MATVGAAEFARFAGASSATLALGCCAIWGGFVLWFHAPGGKAGRWLCVLVWAAFSTAVLVGLWQGRAAAGALLFASAFCALLIGWRRISPSNDRLWADEVAQMTTGSVDGNRVTLHDVRNFDWRTNTDYTPRWETRRYDLDRMQSVDMIVSY